MSDDKRPLPVVAAESGTGIPSEDQGDDKRSLPWPAAVLTALAAMAIVGGAVWWVLDECVLDTELPTPRLEALPGDGQATLKLDLDDPDAEWQYEQRYAGREGEYGPPDRWKPLPRDGVVTGLTNDWGYVFRVRAVSGEKRGLPSNEATVTPTAVPARLDAIAGLLAAIEDQLAGIKRGLTSSGSDKQCTKLMARLNAIETHLESIASGTGHKQDSARETNEIARALALFHFPNARLAAGAPAGAGVAVPERAANRTLAALGGCARADDPVVVKPYGFASDAVFRYADGTPMEDSDALNLETANLRASNAYCGLTDRATAYPHVRIEAPHEWSSLEQMTRKRDHGTLITYPAGVRDRERLRRAVVLAVLAPGRCTFE